MWASRIAPLLEEGLGTGPIVLATCLDVPQRLLSLVVESLYSRQLPCTPTALKALLYISDFLQAGIQLREFVHFFPHLPSAAERCCSMGPDPVRGGCPSATRGRVLATHRACLGAQPRHDIGPSSPAKAASAEPLRCSDRGGPGPAGIPGHCGSLRLLETQPQRMGCCSMHPAAAASHENTQFSDACAGPMRQRISGEHVTAAAALPLAWLGVLPHSMSEPKSAI